MSITRTARWIVVLASLLSAGTAAADDTCVFATTADDIPPNIVILLDNGAAMEEIAWHGSYGNSLNYSPNACTDVVQNAIGNGFCRDKGYAVRVTGGRYSLVEVPDSLVVASSRFARLADGDSRSPVWTINGKTVTLPAVPANYAVGGVIDKAVNFRYSKNYLNWIFGSNPAVGSYAGNGSDLPATTRFYFAKKALLTVAKLAANKAKLSIYAFTSNSSGASSVQPLGFVVNWPLADDPANNTLDSNFVNNINNLNTVTYSPLAEGLASIAGYYNSSSSHIVENYCGKSFALVVSPGLSSEDQSPAAGSTPSSFSDYDADGSQTDFNEGKIKAGVSIYDIPTNQNGTTFLDDVAHYVFANDIVGYQPGFQNLRTYTVGFMGDLVNRLFLINTSNNGNGKKNLYDPNDDYYGKYHYEAQEPDQLAPAILAAVTDIISQTNSFTAPVVPVTRTTSGNRIYIAFFKPSEGNFWEGNLTKFALSASLQIVDRRDQPATWPNGAIRESAEPFWQTKDWATPEKDNYVGNADRKICTYLGGTAKSLLDATNAFAAGNTGLTAAVLGNPASPLTADQIINYLRGADVFDEDEDENMTENRAVITGDILHSEPLVFRYNYTQNTSRSYVFYGANDGMLHAVYDESYGLEDLHRPGTEVWGFIPPDLLPRLKDLLETTSHQFYVDASPKIYFKDVNHNGLIETGDQIILVSGERKGGSSYFALDITDPEAPVFLWRIGPSSTVSSPPDVTIAELGQSWSEPQFGVVKTSAADTVGTPVMFIGGGYSENNSSGKAILLINVFTGAVVKMFKNTDTLTSMNYSIPSSVTIVDWNDNGFIDKVYVGDTGGQLWRIGKFATATSVSLPFPDCDENIANWEAQVIFVSDSTYARKFFYPPALTLEKGYDLLFIGTGDRENACALATEDRYYCIRDKQLAETYYEADLIDMTGWPPLQPALDTLSADIDADGRLDQGWFIRLGAGEKVLSESLVYYKTTYFTTFVPYADPCVPGGYGYTYALNYKKAAAVLDFSGDGTKDPAVLVGGGIPSKVVPVITDYASKVLISVGSTNADSSSESFAAGVLGIDPLSPGLNFHYKWWREILN